MNHMENGPTWAPILPERLLKNCKVLPQRSAILPLLPKQAVFCEVGVALGDFTKQILDECNVSKFYAIDLFFLHKAPQMWGGRVGRELGDLDHLEYYRRKFAGEIDEGKFKILQGDSVECIGRLPDQSVDVAYIDANHSYDFVKKELASIKRKMKNDSYIIMNDYIMEDWVSRTRYGVIQATHEFMLQENWEMIHFALHSGMFCDVTLRKL